MAFASAVTQRPVAFGNKRMSWGTYTNAGGDTGGDVDTGLRMCEVMILQPGDAAVNANAPSVNETLPIAGSAVTIVTDDGADGYWFAIGY